MKIVEVIWIDIVSDDGWRKMDKLDKFIHNDKHNEVNQIGYLYEEDEDKIVLLNSVFTDKSLFGDVTKIPKGCVKSVTELTKK